MFWVARKPKQSLCLHNQMLSHSPHLYIGDIFVCTCRCAYPPSNVGVCTGVETGVKVTGILNHSPLYSFCQTISLGEPAVYHWVCLYWQASSRNPSVLTFPAVIPGMCHYSQHAHRCWGSELMSQGLCDKHYTSRTTSPAPRLPYLETFPIPS